MPESEDTTTKEIKLKQFTVLPTLKFVRPKDKKALTDATFNEWLTDLASQGWMIRLYYGGRGWQCEIKASCPYGYTKEKQADHYKWLHVHIGIMEKYSSPFEAFRAALLKNYEGRRLWLAKYPNVEKKPVIKLL